MTGALLVALATSPSFVRAQSTAADIIGIVKDPSGAVVPNVSVKAVHEGTNFSRQTKTNAEGIYEFRILPPGTYTVSAEATGFKKYINEHLPLDSRQVLRIDIALAVGNLNDAVTVVAEAPVITTETPTISETRKFLTDGPQGTPIMTFFGKNTTLFSLLVRDAQKGEQV
jgi:hypothetical protein